MFTSMISEGNNLAVTTNKAIRVEQPLEWWRDHCQCADCVHPDTKQRQLNTFGFPEELNTRIVKITPDGLFIKWSDEHISNYTASFVENLRPDPAILPVNRTLWNTKNFNNFHPYVRYEEFIQDDNTLLEFLEFVEEFGFSFVEGTPPTAEATKAVSERVAYIRQTIFGGYYEMTANLEHNDTAYTPLAIGPHTDGTYSNDAPSYQVLHCLEENCIGGENVLIDGFKIAQIMQDKYPDDYYTLTYVDVPGQYIDTQRGIHLMAQRPLFRVKDFNLMQVSYNNHDRAPFTLDPDTTEKFYKALNTFARLCAKPEFHYRRKLQPGSCLFFDNWRILHARDAYSGYRKLAGAYFNKEDVESKLRVLRNAT